MKLPTLSLVLALLVTAAAPARADDRAAAREHYAKGTKAYDLGLYDEAITEYMEAYRLKDDPAILYNLGQAHRLANHPAEALRFYRMFLTKVPRAQNRDEVQLKIDELQKLLDQQKKTQSLPPAGTLGGTGEPVHPAPATTASPTAPPTAAAAPEPPAASTAAPFTTAVDSRPGRTRVIAGATVAGVGVALLATGIALGVLAKQDSDTLSGLKTSGAPWDPALASQGATYGAVGPALAAIGGAAVVAGTVVAVLGARANARARRMAVSPALSASGAALVVSGRF